MGLSPTSLVVAPAIDLSAQKCPPVKASTLAAIEKKVDPPKLEPQMDGPTGVTRSKVVEWVDRYRAQSVRLRGIARELARHVAECRTPL